MSPILAARVLVVVVAVAAAYLLLSRNSDENACRDAGDRVFAASGGFEPIDRLEPAIEDVRDRCEGAGGLLTAAETLRQASGRRRVLAPLAVDLAREGTRIEPDNYVAWATLAVTLARTDPDGARDAFARARELNPRLATPPALRDLQAEPR